jgi:hypothetical protein
VGGAQLRILGVANQKEWKAFVERVQLKFFEVDNEVPILPPKDVIVSDLSKFVLS